MALKKIKRRKGGSFRRFARGGPLEIQDTKKKRGVSNGNASLLLANYLSCLDAPRHLV